MASEESAVFFNVILYEMLIGDVHNEKKENTYNYWNNDIILCLCCAFCGYFKK